MLSCAEALHQLLQLHQKAFASSPVALTFSCHHLLLELLLYDYNKLQLLLVQQQQQQYYLSIMRTLIL